MTDRSLTSLSSAVVRGAVVGAGLGFIDTALTYLTGSAPFRDVFPMFGVPVLVMVAASVALLPLSRRSADGKRIDAVVLGLPILAFGLRGCLVECDLTWWGVLVRWAPSVVLLAGLLALLFARRARWTPQGLAAVGLVLHLVAALAFAERTDEYPAMDTQVLLVALALSSVVLALLLFVTRRRAFDTGTALAYACTLGVGCLLLAASLRSSRPHLGTPPPAVRAAAPASPNVVLIVMDTVRADHVGVYGYRRATTPNIDKLAQHAIVFDRATTNATYSLAAHASLLTGALPSEHGAHVIPPAWAAKHPTLNLALGSFKVREGVSTMAEELRGRGYATAGISANDVYLAEWTGLQRGFQQFAAHARRRYRTAPLASPIMTQAARLFGRRAFNPQDTWPAVDVVRAASDWVAATAPRPFFLFLNIFDAHDPYTPPGGSRFRGDGLGSDEHGIPEYDAEIRIVDRYIGRLLDDLRARSLYDSSLVIVTADHGQFFGEHGLFGHPHQLYEPVLHVPLIVKLPGQTEPMRVSRRFGLHEVRRLVMEVLANPGRRPDLESAEETPQVLAQSWAESHEDPTDPDQIQPGVVAVYTRDHKLIHRRSGPSELFALASDPGETRDLLVAPNDHSRATARRLAAVALVPVGTAGRGTLPDTSPETVDRLRALGYVN